MLGGYLHLLLRWTRIQTNLLALLVCRRLAMEIEESTQIELGRFQ